MLKKAEYPALMFGHPIFIQTIVINELFYEITPRFARAGLA
jgi:hypothetical protein